MIKSGNASAGLVLMSPDFFKKAIEFGGEHLEIETYTFDVLPKALRRRGIVESVADEYAWVLNRL